MRRLFYLLSTLVLIAQVSLGYFFPMTLWSFVIVGPVLALGFRDAFQKKRAVLRNFPIIGHFRYLLEEIRPEIQQYFIEPETGGRPFSRETRAKVYQRAKKALQTLPFGTQLDVYATGYEWINHSLAPTHLDAKTLRVTIGGPQCLQPYSASILNVGAMSFGALSKNAVLALSQGAKIGGFAMDTGEGSISPYHLKGGADLIWQIGTGYFGCRDSAGFFNEKEFQKRALNRQVRMIEVKLSQGAKPGHGGILPAAKITPEIAAIRGLPLGKDIISPPAHSAFSTPIGFLEFIQRLRDLSGGKPVGFKFCLGKRREFLSICKAIVKTQIFPDFIAIDGGEGGTGAAPLEFSNYVGSPLTEGLVFVHNSLRGCDIRDPIKLIASGRITNGFDLISRLAIGADLAYSARGMMLALGCIQALRCNTNKCPVGVATQDPELVAGLNVEDKYLRIANYQSEVIKTAAELMGAMGVSTTTGLRPWHIMRRISSTEVKHYGEIFKYLRPGDLLKSSLPAEYERAYLSASAETFHANEDQFDPIRAKLASVVGS